MCVCVCVRAHLRVCLWVSEVWYGCVALLYCLLQLFYLCVCVCVCVCVCLCIDLRVCACVCVNVYVYDSNLVFGQEMARECDRNNILIKIISMYLYKYIYLCIYTNIYVCIYVFIWIFMCVYIYVYIYMYIYIYIYTWYKLLWIYRGMSFVRVNV